MNSEQFQQQLAKKQAQFKQYVNTVFPGRAANISLRFIEGNFRAQGWQGQTFSPWKENKRKGTILVLTGVLRRATIVQTSPGVARIMNNVKYAAVHNRGFTGTVQVGSYKRTNLSRVKVDTGNLNRAGQNKFKTIHQVKSVATIKAHTRKMNIPKRQFFPENVYDSPVLANAIRREIQRSIKQIFN